VRDPLHGLDEVPWAELSHAYGSAEDVPDWLRDLRSADADDRLDARRRLYAAIDHQGTRYAASAPAVPFLYALAADPATEQRPEIVRLLGFLAIGYEEMWLPAGVDIATWRRDVADAPADDAEYAGYEMATYDAVRATVPGLCALLADPDPRLRAVTAWTLAWFPEESALVVPRLLELVETERVPGVGANALVAAGLLGDAALADRLRPYLAEGEPVLRWAAATALARLGVTDVAVVAELARRGASEPSQEAPRVAFYDGGDIRAYSARSLAALDGSFTDEAVAAVLDGLADVSGPYAFTPTATALRLTFGPEPPSTRPSFAELTEAQRRCVRILAEIGERTWLWNDFTEILRGWHLPDRRDDCRRYAGLPDA
jgi:HEAT repeat protein